MGEVRKSPDAFRTISEVADILDIPAHVLRFWESRFSQIKPVKRGGGRRYYRPSDIDLLYGIRNLLYSDGLTIKGVQKILREQGQKHVAGLGHAARNGDMDSESSEAEIAPEAVRTPPKADPAPTPETVVQTVPDQPARDAPEPGPEPAMADTRPPAPKAAPRPAGRQFPGIDLPSPGHAEPQELQFDLFAEPRAQERRPFPPDPTRAARADKLRSLLGKLEALREKMARGL